MPDERREEPAMDGCGGIADTLGKHLYYVIIHPCTLRCAWPEVHTTVIRRHTEIAVCIAAVPQSGST